MTVVTLLRLLEKLDELGATDVVFAKPEWHPHCEAKVVSLTSEHRVPPEVSLQERLDPSWGNDYRTQDGRVAVGSHAEVRRTPTDSTG